jgi:hypothetical protein
MGGLEDRAEVLRTRAEMVSFLGDLADSLLEEPEVWENDTLEGFLRAWADWLRDMDGYFANRGMPIPESPSWQFVAEMLLAARVYE